MMKQEYLEKIYAGWLAKIVGIRLGAAIEGWTYEKIKNVFGDLRRYPVDYKKLFAADDDSNGPLFFLRALEDSSVDFDLQAQDVGEALLNYAPFEHGFFWWGGYGTSTEHTAYLNLRNGITAPRSGSIEQNGSTVAEQIGGQIFIDTWGLVTPGNPDLAAKLAAKAASVTHGGNGIYGGVFVAACISAAFEEQNIRALIEKGLSYIPADCEYTRVVRAVMAFYDAHPDDWRSCYDYIFANFGYDRYPGNCHIIPNSAVMVLSLLYGAGDFSDTINICNMCGWDTDCNVGNIATIMGVLCGLDAIDDEKWRMPINDLLICSSVVGSLNIMDIPYGAAYIAKLAWAMAGEDLPDGWQSLLAERLDSCHFEYRGSTHAMSVRLADKNAPCEYVLRNTDEAAHSGARSLFVRARVPYAGDRAFVYKKTYYMPTDFHDSRYDPSFSPLLYPGQTVHGSALLPDFAEGCTVRLYVHNAATDEILLGEAVELQKGTWSELSFTIPALTDALIDEAGFALDAYRTGNYPREVQVYIDDLYFDGKADYRLNLANSEQEKWPGLHREISQFTRLKGLFYLENEALHLSCGDFAEAYTGHINWADYTATFAIAPQTGARHFVNVRVQGAIRSYAAGLTENGKLGLYKNENGYRKLAEVDLPWAVGNTYTIAVTANGAALTVCVDGQEKLRFVDTEKPYLTGSVGIAVQAGSHCAYHSLAVR